MNNLAGAKKVEKGDAGEVGEEFWQKGGAVIELETGANFWGTDPGVHFASEGYIQGVFGKCVEGGGHTFEER